LGGGVLSKALIFGGNNATGNLRTAEEYDATAGTFAPTANNMADVIQSGARAVVLQSGEVLIVGGFDGTTTLKATQLYDPNIRSFTAGGQMTDRRMGHTVTVLQDGRVLVTGGVTGNPSLASAEVADAGGNAFSTVGSMGTARIDHTATILQDGRVLITGGRDNNTGTVYDTSEIFDPATHQFTPLANRMTVSRNQHFAFLLSNGKVLIAGGSGRNSAELFDPDNNTFSSIGSTLSTTFNTGQGAGAILMSNGKVLLVGGGYTDVYDPATNVFSPTANSPTKVSVGFAITNLSNGKVLLAGGVNGGVRIKGAELYDPSTNAFTAASDMGTIRGDPGAP
jgi:N-acetylneuraminic acid mutarotase